MTIDQTIKTIMRPLQKIGVKLELFPTDKRAAYRDDNDERTSI